MIVVCDLVCWGMQHIPFNAGVLETIRFAFPHQSVVFSGEKSHLDYVRMQMRSEIASSISWKPVRLPPRHAPFSRRWITDLKLLAHFLKKMDEDPPAHLVLTNAAPSTVMALKTLLHGTHRGKNAQVVLHANLASLNGRRSRNPFVRMQDLRTAMTFANNARIQYIVLEESIREALLHILPSLRGDVFVLDHPVPPSESPEHVIDFQPPFRFGFLGLATEGKGFPQYVRVASEMTRKLSGHVEFHMIGRAEQRQELLNLGPVMGMPNAEALTRNEYVSRLRKLHFVCLPYERKHYELRPSGVLADAIAWEKPVIASRLAIFESVFEKFGDIGYLYDTEQECAEIIERLVTECDTAKYREQVVSTGEVRRSRTAESLAPRYREVCKAAHPSLYPTKG